MKTKDPDVLALKKACQALEQSTSKRVIKASLDFMWDRYLVHPPATAWWARHDAERPS